MLKVSFEKAGKDVWIPSTEYRPGYWLEGFARVHLEGLHVIYPIRKGIKKKDAINKVIDAAIEELNSKRIK